MGHREQAAALRADPTTHYNCCQSVIIPYADACGITGEQARALGTYFNAGMRCGGMCGAVSGGLMVLGMAGKEDAAAEELRRKFLARNGHLNCAELLRQARENGEERKPHCDRMVLDAVEMLDELL